MSMAPRALSTLLEIAEGHEQRIEQVRRAVEAGGEGLLWFEELLDLRFLDFDGRAVQLGQLLAQVRPLGDADTVERHKSVAVRVKPAAQRKRVGRAAVDRPPRERSARPDGK